MRLFIALPLTGAVENQLADLITTLKAKGGSVKWVKAHNIHLTLRFLGETDENLLDKIKAEIDSVASAHGRVETSISHLGAFPNLNRPRVIWVGIESRLEQLQKMARDMELRVRKLRFEKEERPFKAHLTLGRIRVPKGLENLTGFMKDYELSEIPLLLDRIVLFKSTLTPQGPIYERLHEAKLSVQ